MDKKIYYTVVGLPCMEYVDYSNIIMKDGFYDDLFGFLEEEYRMEVKTINKEKKYFTITRKR